MEEEPIEVDIAETEATDSGDVEELMADPDMDDADESDVLLEETEVDAGGDEDEEDDTFIDVAEVETGEDEDDDEATVEVEEEEEEEDDDERGIFRSLLSLFKRS